MDWSTLTINVNYDLDGVSTPIKNQQVTFVLYDSTNQKYYYIDKTTDTNGVATLPASNSFLSERVNVAVVKSKERNGSGNDSEFGTATSMGNSARQNQGRSAYNNEEPVTQAMVNNVSKWFAFIEINGTYAYSEYYEMTTTTGYLTYEIDENGNPKSQQGASIKVYVKYQKTSIADAHVYYWFYNENNDFLGKGNGITVAHGSEIYYEITNIPSNATKYIVHAYYINGSTIKENIDESKSTITQNQTNTKTVAVDSLTGFHFETTGQTNVDTLYHYIGENINIYPVKLTISNKNGSNIINQTTAYSAGALAISTTSSTQYVRFKVTPIGTTNNYYAESTCEFNIFGYIGGYIGNVETMIPRKEYTVSMPAVYDTAAYDNASPLAGVVTYNLPNVNMNVEFHTWNYSCTYELETNSNVSTITIRNSEIQNSELNKNWFYRCLAGDNITYYNTVKFNLSKHHYENEENGGKQLSLVFSGGSKMISGTFDPVTTDTINRLYACVNQRGTTSPNGGSEGPITKYSTRLKVITFEREKNVVFRQNELVDYVKGFKFGYAGKIGYENFSLSQTTKAPASISGNGSTGFYYNASTNLSNVLTATTLADFKDNNSGTLPNFVSALSHGIEYKTTYALSASSYSDNNKHCYVMENSFVPNAGDKPDYFYFRNESSNPVNLTGYTNEELAKIEKTVGIKLKKHVDADIVSLEYSYDNLPWRPYTIGEEIYIAPGVSVFFRATSSNPTFSKNDTDYYSFYVNNNLKNNEIDLSYNDLINEFAGNGTETDTSVVENKINYRVLVGGRISSLLRSTPTDSVKIENNCFNYLFVEDDKNHGTKITDASNLKLDSLTIKSKAYLYMFAYSFLMTKGPSIAATSIEAQSMQAMFYCSSVTGLSKNELFFTTVKNYCCQSMFKNSRYNETLKINATAGGASTGFFKTMFENCSGYNAKVSVTGLTTFGASACTQMFYNSKTHCFSNFANKINEVGNYSFYEAYRNTHLASSDGDVTFQITGKTGYRSCSYMFANISESFKIDNMILNPTTSVGEECYSYMFSNSNVHGQFTFDEVITASTKGCEHMFENSGPITIKGSILSPTVLGTQCYDHMFCGSKLSIVPRLPATTLSYGCYRHMFEHSSVIHIINSTDAYYENTTGGVKTGTEVLLNATTLPEVCYEYMFADTHIKRILKMITENLQTVGTRSCSHMFDKTWIEFEPRSRTIVQNNTSNTRFLQIKSLKKHTFAGNDTDKVRYYPLTVPAGQDAVFLHTQTLDMPYCVDNVLCRDAIISGGCIYVLTGIGIYRQFYSTIPYKLVGFYDDDTAGTVYGNVSSPTKTDECYLRKNSNGDWVMYYTNNGVDTLTSEVASDERYFVNIGPFATFSTTEGALTGYSYVVKERFVDLNATSISPYCYEYMFANCPNLYAGHHFRFCNLSSTVEGCFSHMFEHCNNLRSIQPAISSLTLSTSCFESMYSHCGEYYEDNRRTGLNPYGLYAFGYITGVTPAIYHKYPNDDYTSNTMYGYGDKCGIFPDINNYYNMAAEFKSPTANYCYKTMFAECNCISDAFIHIKADTNMAKGSCAGMFCGCTRMESAQSLRNPNNTLEIIPLLDVTNVNNTAGESSCENMFKYCLGLVYKPCNTLHKNVGKYAYDSMFAYCQSLSASPLLPASTISEGGYRQMFYRATNATNRYTFEYSYTGTGYVHASGTYTGGARLYLHIKPNKVWFTVETTGGDKDWSPRVRYVGGDTGNLSSYRTWYTNQTVDSMTSFKFQQDVLEGLRQKFYDTTFQEFFENNQNQNLMVGYPDNLYIESHLNELTSLMRDFMNSYYDRNTYHRDYYDWISQYPTVIVKITNYSITNNGSNTYLNGTSGIKNITAALTQSQIGTNGTDGTANKTYQWVYMLSTMKGKFITRTSNYPTATGQSAIPTEWTTEHTYVP